MLLSEALEMLLTVALPLLPPPLLLVVVDVFFRLLGRALSMLLQVLSQLPAVKVL